MSRYRALSSRLVALPRPAKRFIAASCDIVLLVLAFHVALWLRFELFFSHTQYMWYSLLAAFGGVLSLAGLGLYRMVVRYLSERVVLVIVAGVLMSVLLVAAANTFLHWLGLSRAVLMIYAGMGVASLVGVRVLARRLLLHNPPASDLRVPVLIYGAGTAGLQLATALEAGHHYRPVAMLDDDAREKQGLYVSGLRVYGPSDLPALIQREGVRHMLIAMPSATPSRIRQIIQAVERFRLRIRVLDLGSLVDGQITGASLRDIDVGDLLGRDPVPPLPELMGRCVQDRVVMVTGAGGSIGSELCRQIVRLRPTRLVLFETSEPSLYAIEQELRRLSRGTGLEIVAVLGSVRDSAYCQRQILQHGVATIYHAAAYKHVPMVEFNIAEGVRNNVLGTLSLVQAAIAGGVADFVLVSTDKAVRPTSVMGASKRLAELVLQAHARMQSTTRLTMVRFGNVLGSSGSVVPLFERQIRAGGPITLTDAEITRYFMTIPEASQLVLQAGGMGVSGEVFVLDMGEPVKIIDLARRMVHLHGLEIRDADHPEGDIPIQVTGLRPGEKLYEELLIGGNVESTAHPRIMRAREYEIDYDTLIKELDALRTELDADDSAAVVQRLRRLMPEYVPDIEGQLSWERAA